MAGRYCQAQIHIGPMVAPSALWMKTPASRISSWAVTPISAS